MCKEAACSAVFLLVTIKAASRYRNNFCRVTCFETGSLKMKDFSVWQAKEKNWWWNA